MEATLLVLAGGDSRRMGRPKAWIEVGDTVLLRYVVERLAPAFSEVMVSFAEPEQMEQHVPYRVVFDRKRSSGPLAGLEAGLVSCRPEVLFAGARDMPYVAPPPGGVAFAGARRCDPAIPAHDRPFDALSVADPGRGVGGGEGLQLKEWYGGQGVLVSMGPERAKAAIRKGLSMGAGRGVLVADPQLAGADALLTARVMAAAIKQESPDLVICATESYDGSTGMVPPMLAELLGFPQLTFAKKVEVDGPTIKIHRQTAAGYQIVEAPAPVLVTVTAAI